MRRVVFRRASLLIAVLAIAAASLPGPSDAARPVDPPGSERLLAALSAQETATAALIDRDGVVGTALGTTPAGTHEVLVLVESPRDADSVPTEVDGVGTRVIVTGEIRTQPCPTGRTGDCSAPIPAGVSTGHPSITAGTLGGYVRNGDGDYFALSNNHIFAAENQASLGDVVLQPGAFDGGSVSIPSHVLGTLADYQPLQYCSGVCTGPNNAMDAAIVSVDASTVQAENYCGWTPAPETRSEASLSAGSTVLKKCGRTTGATYGTVLGVNATVNVTLRRGTARFVGQIITEDMSDGGDSGSVMLDEQNRATALLYAGSDTLTIATPIDDVLVRFGVTMVSSDPPAPPANAPPQASFAISCSDLACSFDASASDDTDGSIVSYTWSFGDGAAGAGEEAEHTYATGGSYTVALTVIDDDGATDSTTRTARPTDPPPPAPPANALPEASFTTSCVALSCSFDATASTDPDGFIVAYDWSFGDGASGSGETPVHTYAAGDSYTVSLTVTDDDGATSTTTRTAKPSDPAPAAPPSPVDEVGMVDPRRGLWELPVTSAGPNTRSLAVFYFGNPGDTPIVGDWDCDGIATPGMYRATDGYVYLRNSNTQGIADTRFFFGNPGDVPLAGDWNGDGCDTVSLYRPSEARFYIIDELGSDDGGLGAARTAFSFGDVGDTPVAGDWNGDGRDDVGLHRASSGLFYWRTTLTSGTADGRVVFGDPGDRFVAGDWGTVDGRDSPALFRPDDLAVYVRYSLTQGPADASFPWAGADPSFVPVAGRFS